MRFLGVAASEREAWRVERGECALDRLEEAVAGAPFLTNGNFSIADIALLAYTRVAAEGGFDLRCLIPTFNGAIFSTDWKDALWAKFYTGAPARQRRASSDTK